MKNFILKQGIFVSDVADCTSGYVCFDSENITASVSAEKLKALTVGGVKLLAEPVFFFAEVPCDEDEEKKLGGGLHRNVYYLDNCTAEVAQAIIKRYSDLLFSDGVLQFGFGSHVDSSEIFLRKYQVASIYSPDISPFKKLFSELSIPEADKLITLGSVIGENNHGECVIVEANGETIFDMIENLAEAGLYKSHVSDDE